MTAHRFSRHVTSCSFVAQTLVIVLGHGVVTVTRCTWVMHGADLSRVNALSLSISDLCDCISHTDRPTDRQPLLVRYWKPLEWSFLLHGRGTCQSQINQTTPCEIRRADTTRLSILFPFIILFVTYCVLFFGHTLFAARRRQWYILVLFKGWLENVSVSRSRHEFLWRLATICLLGRHLKYPLRVFEVKWFLIENFYG